MRRIVLAIVLAIVLLSPGATASGHYSGTGQSSPYLRIKPYSYNSTWMTPMDRAVSNWSSHPCVNINRNSSNPSIVKVEGVSGVAWVGRYTRHSSTRFTVTLNSTRINQLATNHANYVQSVLAHEFGHALNLAHNSLTSIMNESRNRNVLRTRQSHDTSDVSSYYSSQCVTSLRHPHVVELEQIREAD